MYEVKYGLYLDTEMNKKKSNVHNEKLLLVLNIFMMKLAIL